MINVQMTVAEAIGAAAVGGNELHDRIVKAIEVALGINQSRCVTITGGMTTDNRIKCIKAIRGATGWGLKDTKDWTDVLVGHYDSYGQWKNGYGKNSLTLKTPYDAENLLRELTDLGCQGHLS